MHSYELAKEENVEIKGPIFYSEFPLCDVISNLFSCEKYNLIDSDSYRFSKKSLESGNWSVPL